MSAILKLEHVSYLYSKGTPFEKKAIDDINLEIQAGEMVGIIGHTGSGKSTLVQHLNGLLEPTEGKIYIDGQDLWADRSKLRSFRFQVGLVFQYPEYQLFEETVYKDIAFGPKNMGLSEEEIHRRVLQAAAFVGLREEQLQKSPFELSGGQKRRVAIAGVLAMEPQILVLDEPTAGLDPRGRDLILDQIKAYHQEKKNTVLLISHSMEDVAKYATKVLVMNQAKVYLYGTVQEVFSHAQEIEKLGLDVPQVTKICLELKRRGYPIPGDIYTVEQAQKVLSRLVAQGGPCHA